MANNNPTLDFSTLIDFGENPNGTVVQAPSGTMYPVASGVAGADGRQWNWCAEGDGDRWNKNPLPLTPPESPDPMPAPPGHVRVHSHIRRKP